ncbi:MAG TPA: hypothetical protein VKA34_05565 [Balneolales bacterium]|nr:hypothetical protein [Balneolales bacterium]
MQTLTLKLNDMQIPKEEYEKLAKEIENLESPVGIDAKKTHIMILYKLHEIEDRIDQLEKQLLDKKK